MAITSAVSISSFLIIINHNITKIINKNNTISLHSRHHLLQTEIFHIPTVPIHKTFKRKRLFEKQSQCNVSLALYTLQEVKSVLTFNSLQVYRSCPSPLPLYSRNCPAIRPRCPRRCRSASRQGQRLTHRSRWGWQAGLGGARRRSLHHYPDRPGTAIPEQG